jgi:outer membrane protein TolC
VAEDKFTNNQSSLQTIYKAQARLAELDNMSGMLNGRLYESITGINILLVRDVSTPFEIDTLLIPAGYSGVALTYREGSRSDIAALSYSIESMKKEQVQMKLEGRPDFGIRAEHMQMFGMPNQWTLMGMLTIPIVPWSSGMYRSETRSADFRIQAMEKEKKVMELMADKMVSEKYYMLKSETDQYVNYQQSIIPAYEKNFEANLLAYRRNTGDFFVLLDAWEMMLMKKLESLDRLDNVFKLQAEYEYETETR